jgi:hypothetical protein
MNSQTTNDAGSSDQTRPTTRLQSFGSGLLLGICLPVAFLVEPTAGLALLGLSIWCGYAARCVDAEVQA